MSSARVFVGSRWLPSVWLLLLLLWLVLCGTTAAPTTTHPQQRQLQTAAVFEYTFVSTNANDLCWEFNLVYNGWGVEKFGSVCHCTERTDNIGGGWEVRCWDQCDRCTPDDDDSSSSTCHFAYQTAVLQPAFDGGGGHILAILERCYEYNNENNDNLQQAQALCIVEEPPDPLFFGSANVASVAVNGVACASHNAQFDCPDGHKDLQMDCTNVDGVTEIVNYCDTATTFPIPFARPQFDYAVGKCQGEGDDSNSTAVVSVGVVQGTTTQEVCDSYMANVIGWGFVEKFQTECECTKIDVSENTEQEKHYFHVVCADRCQFCDTTGHCGRFSAESIFQANINGGLFYSRDWHCNQYDASLNYLLQCFEKTFSLTSPQTGRAFINNTECHSWSVEPCPGGGGFDQRIDCTNMVGLYDTVFDFCRPETLVEPPFLPQLEPDFYGVGECLPSVNLDAERFVSNGEEEKQTNSSGRTKRTRWMLVALLLITFGVRA